MSALAAERNTPSLGKSGLPDLSWPIADNVKVYKGSLVMESAGYATPGATATGKLALGRAAATVDNTVSGHTAGALNVPIERGIFRWGNSAAGDAIAQADCGATCYMVDDQTVAKTDGTGTRSAAGTVVAVDSSGVWVSSGNF